MQDVLNRILRRFIVHGRLDVTWPDGANVVYGDGIGPACAVRLTTKAAIRQLILDPTVAMGEQYMAGGLAVLRGTIYDFLDIVGLNLRRGPSWPGLRLHHMAGRMRRGLDQFNPRSRSRRNVAHHYDLSGELYALFLDADRQYSCAYFRHGTETLDEAQDAKKRHIAAKLLLDPPDLHAPDLHILDIGCGWGGMALYLARMHGCRVTGITLSEEQLTEARRRADAAGLADRVHFELRDYRALGGRYDRIVSVGMFEHVGVGHYREFFATLRKSLVADGVALLHSIGRSHGPLSTNRWIARYIFPGGYAPALSEVMPAIERSGLMVTDIEILRLHYAMTLQCWRRNFALRRDRIAALYDERFCRMFEFYLALSEISFRHLDSMNLQIQLTRDRAAVPLTRDYIAQAEAPQAWRSSIPEKAVPADAARPLEQPSQRPSQQPLQQSVTGD